MPYGVTQESFTHDLREWSRKLKINTATLQKKITYGIHANLVGSGHPVKTGRARANWFVTEGAPSQEVDDFPGLSKGAVIPPPTPANIDVHGTQPTFIVNNLPYIQKLDEGSSTQAPAGMVKRAIEKMDAEVKDALLEVERGE